jgi:hypothetical protein
MKSKMVKSDHHRGKEVPLWVLLGDLAAQEGCDGSPYDEMQMASDYIRELEEELKPYREMEKILSDKIKKKLEEKEEKIEPEDTEPALTVGLDSHAGQPPMAYTYHEGECIICGGEKTIPHYASNTNMCAFCGQKYERH